MSLELNRGRGLRDSRAPPPAATTDIDFKARHLAQPVITVSAASQKLQGQPSQGPPW